MIAGSDIDWIEVIAIFAALSVIGLVLEIKTKIKNNKDRDTYKF